MSTVPEPAIKSYFFGKGYRDLKETIADSWRRNLASAKDHFSKVQTYLSTDEKPWAIVWGTAGVSVILFGTAIFLLASAVHVVVLLTFFLLIYLGFTLVYLAERGYLACKRFFTVCPHCHSKSGLPEYFCPGSGCGEIHRRLIPSSYGILYHTCTCGEKLPATFFLKRGELAARCADCEQLLDRLHVESKKAFVPIYGGPAVGKSAYLFAAVAEFIDEKVAELGFSASFLEAQTENDFRRIRKGLAEGRTPAKTQEKLPRALNLKLDRKRGSPWVLYLYDPAGEAFGETEGLVLHKYQEYLSGLIFLVDPFSIPAVLREYDDRLPAVRGALKPSELPIEDALSRILISLEENFGLKKTAKVKMPRPGPQRSGPPAADLVGSGRLRSAAREPVRPGAVLHLLEPRPDAQFQPPPLRAARGPRAIDVDPRGDGLGLRREAPQGRGLKHMVTESATRSKGFR